MNYFFEPTLDGSFTLRLLDKQGQKTESMHSTKGAFSETLFIYGQAVQEILARQWPVRLLSIGLGLGYIEFLSFALCLKAGVTELYLDSYEEDPQLRLNLEHFLLKPEWLKQNHQAFYKVYEDILSRCALELNLDPLSLHKQMAQALARGELNLRESFSLHSWPAQTYSGILFDAFSTQTSPDLWTAEILEKVLETLSAPQAVFATYASTGHLKRALQKYKFARIRQQGFGGKRESTLAARGL